MRKISAILMNTLLFMLSMLQLCVNRTPEFIGINCRHRRAIGGKYRSTRAVMGSLQQRRESTKL
jgi:hypothetical protein